MDQWSKDTNKSSQFPSGSKGLVAKEFRIMVLVEQLLRPDGIPEKKEEDQPKTLLSNNTDYSKKKTLLI